MPISQRQFNAILRYSEMAYATRKEHPNDDAQLRKSNAYILKALRYLEAITTPVLPWKKKLSMEEARKILCFDILMNAHTHSSQTTIELLSFREKIAVNLNQYFNPPIPYQYTLNPKQMPSPLPYFFDVYIKNKATILGLVLLTALVLFTIPGFPFFLGLGIGLAGAAMLSIRAYKTKTRTTELQQSLVANPPAAEAAKADVTVEKQGLLIATSTKHDRSQTPHQQQRSIFAAINPPPLPDAPTSAPTYRPSH